MTAVLPARLRKPPGRRPAGPPPGPEGNGPRVTWLGRLASGLTAAALGVAAWQVLSLFSDGWMPGAGEVAAATADVLTDSGFYGDAWLSLRRVLTVLAASVLAGLLIGIAAGLSRYAEAFLRPILVIGLAIPDPVYIILTILIMGISETSGVVALVVAITPLVANVVSGAVLARDHSLDEMARTYRLGPAAYARHVLAAQVRPAVVGALRTSFAFSWKLVVLMETMTRPDGVGARIYEAFRFLRPEDMIACALVFTVLMRVIEVLALRRLDRPLPH
ncbi:ABC transporter permease subunit [Streptomyces sp. MP131-18]|uniref:ABC transporter permease n=1 Tax=Streptomyces sp. MP131-18 TaxID=1857892 RepID=UPI00097BBEEB|nr:ABC transporter permease subunit [Streptomyces sp. MP131-18]ONK12445.1 putative aliphatic sulfonates transport permeaseprotein SsuC [Streptomyces sp. MP131-18]